MLFPGNALASGPQAWLGAEKELFKVKVGKLGKSLDKENLLKVNLFNNKPLFF
jgi:hypothetical protein